MWLLSPGLAWAQPAAESPTVQESSLRVRGGVGGALLVSPDQTGVLGFQGAGPELTAELGYAVKPWIEPHVVLLGGFFPAKDGRDAGGLLAPLAGVRVGTTSPAQQVYASFQIGPGFTGTRVRPFLRVGLGVDFRVSRTLTLGPRVGYFRLVRVREPNHTTDARGVDLWLSLGFRPTRAQPKNEPPPAPPETIERQTWIEREAPPADPPPPAEPSEELELLLEQAVPSSRVELLAPVLFRFDSDELEPIGVAMLHEIARVLQHRSDIQLLEIQGYADARGASDYNEALSLRRAERVRQWLIAHGVEPARLTVAGHGASNPIEQGSGEDDHQQNRRVVFRVLQVEQP